MSSQKAYGDSVAQILRIDEAPAVVRQKGIRQEYAATLVRSENPSSEKSDPLPTEDSIIASVSLTEGLDREIWLNGRALSPQGPQPAGGATLLDLRHDNRVRFKSGFNLVHFYFARSALNGMLEQLGARRIDELRAQTGVLSPDPTLAQLASALLPSLVRPQDASPIFVDHVLHAVAAHLMSKFADVDRPAAALRGGLAPWQQKRATELLAENLDGSLSLADVAAECELSASHFSRAFVQSMGMPPHRWLQKQRIEKAKSLLASSTISLAEIARMAGFGDQSHFSRVFSQIMGTSPGTWRRIQHQ
ncbi:helix-turn-helix transcriptional regulator [Bradyrhizobium sp. Arg62]|uniref:AraC family transcriptional regulator n=1 Tax=Bradyrhizobium brasilense TaxID=1419277 RepID=UPI001E466B05|nr:AraC family transcriptional regulator [Bradyrhizobium brasilense]MCC8943545.1 helix-turn-helix transcriptional regulator [Bradyrhizobium brasilense]